MPFRSNKSTGRELSNCRSKGVVGSNILGAKGFRVSFNLLLFALSDPAKQCNAKLRECCLPLFQIETTYI